MLYISNAERRDGLPIKIPEGLPAKELLEKENIFVMGETRAITQDIRPLRILILNLMPLKEKTELQFLRLLSNSPLQLEIEFLTTSSHNSKNTSIIHMEKFYSKFDEVKSKKFDGMIITGAPVENLEYEEVDYWKELVEIMDWSKKNVISTIYICWAAQAALYHFFELTKRKLRQKVFGVYWHDILIPSDPLVRGFDEKFLAPHSRYTEVAIEDIRKCNDINILAASKKVGFFLGTAENGKQIFVMGHPEYDKFTLFEEYKRDLSKGVKISKPCNYFKDNNPNKTPLFLWKAHANNLYSNWLNYYVYQMAPF